MATALDLFHNLVACSVIKLHSDFQKGLAAFAVEFVEESECFFGVRKIAGYDNVSVHVLCYVSLNIR